jgi:hypothetical protein
VADEADDDGKRGLCEQTKSANGVGYVQSRQPVTKLNLRILLVNAFHYMRGGVERTYFDESRLLQAGGHTVAHFAAHHAQNVPSPTSEFFAPAAEYGEGARPLQAVGQLSRVILVLAGREGNGEVGGGVSGLTWRICMRLVATLRLRSCDHSCARACQSS